ncbi:MULTISPECIES: CsgE family curli-type amyloid fiber assembly protein [Pseudomonas]|uniref:CsgE family curli-type amyloid fiber assembly protein n=1 Tax=Pseudomonas TaxID=286 RepID=UPI00123C5131|nr:MULTISPECIES: CsgE family curli-type amyloid fiber assembly protein [Pseudomonas]QIB49839.1 curli production assembly protein CsgE [Pseudomonas sp. OIL-1]
MKALTLVLALCCALSAHADEAELSGFIIDHTISRTGQEFYRYFSERITDIGDPDFNLVVKERPSARWGVLIWVEQDGTLLYRQFMQPSLSDVRDTAYAAADFVVDSINRRKIEAMFTDPIDLAEDEL